MPTLPAGLPVWAYVLFAIVVMVFGGGGLLIRNLRQEVRDSKLQPKVEASQDLENQKAAAEIADMLREAQRNAIADMRTMLVASRAEAMTAVNEARAARHETSEIRARLESVEMAYASFRRRLADWMQQRGYDLPDWWHDAP